MSVRHYFHLQDIKISIEDVNFYAKLSLILDTLVNKTEHAVHSYAAGQGYLHLKMLNNAQCEISLQIFRSQKTCQMNWNSILEKTGLEI